MGVLTLADEGVIAGYCQAYSDWLGALSVLRRGGKGMPRGSAERRRVEITAEQALQAMLRTGAKLGLSPADRVGLHADAAEDDTDTKTRFFGKGSG